MLVVENLSVDLDSTTILDGLSFAAACGEILAIIGPNGAGKTTLLRAISGLLPIHKGKVKLSNENLAYKSIIERAKLIASVPQASNLPPAFIVQDVVMLGRTPYLNWLGQTSPVDEEITREALSQTQSLELSKRKIAELSAGEQQRVLLARALAQTTPVLIMDEPTTHLDLRYQVKLLELTQELTRKKNLITIIVLHDLNLASRCADQILVLDRGHMAAMGKPEQVLRDDILSRVYQIPIQVEKGNKTLHIHPK
jgi:ABC-type cobalamin/Fe3+-siderophores transport system ATPase subunit